MSRPLPEGCSRLVEFEHALGNLTWRDDDVLGWFLGGRWTVPDGHMWEMRYSGLSTEWFDTEAEALNALCSQ